MEWVCNGTRHIGELKLLPPFDSSHEYIALFLNRSNLRVGFRRLLLEVKRKLSPVIEGTVSM